MRGFESRRVEFQKSNFPFFFTFWSFVGLHSLYNEVTIEKSFELYFRDQSSMVYHRVCSDFRGNFLRYFLHFVQAWWTYYHNRPLLVTVFMPVHWLIKEKWTNKSKWSLFEWNHSKIVVKNCYFSSHPRMKCMLF